MNVSWVVEELDFFIDLTELGPKYEDLYERCCKGSYDEIVAQSVTIEKIFEVVDTGWRVNLFESRTNPWVGHRDEALRVREIVVREDEIRRNLGEGAPELSAAELHGWIWGGAKSLWQSGHYREAVESAIKKLNAETQNKVGRRDVSETNLFKQAFSPNAPKQGEHRLRRVEDDGGETYQSVQRGVFTFAEGIFAGIRNPLGHEDQVELSEQEALEYLAALSVLARWVDGSHIDTA